MSLDDQEVVIGNEEAKQSIMRHKLRNSESLYITGSLLEEECKCAITERK